MSWFSKLVSVLLVAVAMLFGYILACYADDAAEPKRQKIEERENTLNLVDQEKFLLKENDKVAFEIIDLKKDINGLHNKLSAAQTKYDDIQRKIIKVQMMLIK